MALRPRLLPGVPFSMDVTAGDDMLRAGTHLVKKPVTGCADPKDLASTIKAAQVHLAAVGEDWVFKQAYKNAPWAAAQCQDLLRRAERAAGLEKLDGGLWHAYQRKWATERKHPIKDVATAGWHDHDTLTTCYQHTDEATMLKVMESPVKLVSRRAGSAVVETVAAGEL